jgi:hypothetical protein
LLGQVRQLSRLVATVAALALCACPNDPQKSPPAAAVAGADAGARAPADAFHASLTGPGQIAVGKQGEVVVEVAARGGFHVNDEYPHTFRPTQGGEGVQFGADRYDLRQGWERTPCPGEPAHACAFRARVPFQATAKGSRRAGGVVALSVCNPEICLIEKVPVSAAIEATE